MRDPECGGVRDGYEEDKKAVAAVSVVMKFFANHGKKQA